MQWFRKREIAKKLKPKQIEDALKTLALPPVRDYLVALIDELVRQGIYLSRKEQEGVKFTVKILMEEIGKGDAILKREKKK